MSESDKELALVVLGMAMASAEVLRAVKESLRPADFGALLIVAKAVMDGDKSALSKEVSSRWGVRNGGGKTAFALLEAFANRAAKKHLGSLVNSVVLRTQSLNTDKAKEAIAELTALLGKLKGEDK